MTADISTVLKMLAAYRKQLTAKSARCLMDFVKNTNIRTPSPLNDVARATGEAESGFSSPVIHHAS